VTRSTWNRRRAVAATAEIVAGLGATLLAGSVLGAAPDAGAPLDAPDAPEPHPPDPDAPRQTLAAQAPHPIGPDYDQDAAMPRHADDVASYVLKARLDADSHEVEGSGTIEFHNTTSHAVSSVSLHLYLNAFKNTRSAFLGSPFRRSRSNQSTTDWGFIDVRRFTAPTLGGGDLWPKATFDEDGDETSARIPLPKPVEPGEKTTFEMKWTSRLPGIVERTGFSGSFHLVAQWFPKLARLEPSGRWASFVFRPQSEFYADFGSYDVTLDVPRAMTVGATGARVESRTEGARTVERYHADDVHDFAWTAWDGFVEAREDADGVAVRVLAPRGHETNVRCTLSTVRFGLRFYGERFGRYPYRELTVVHPPQSASAAGGMEYPTLITTGGPWYAGTLSSYVERVTLHELGHQWFYGLVATNEHQSPFLDEGLTSYAESLAMDALLGPGSGVALPGLRVSGDAYMRALAAAASHRDVVGRPADAFATFGDVASLVYARTSTILATLAGVWGEEPVVRALGRYARRYRFDHPSPRHLVSAVRDVVGEEAASILSRAVFEGGWVDFVAREVRSAPVRDPAGVFDADSGRETRDVSDETEPTSWRSRVLVYRYGDLELPVDVDLILESGQRVRRTWNGRGRWTALEHVGAERVVGALVDPEVRIPLDENLLDNAVSESGGTTGRVLDGFTYAAEVALGSAGP
jgi:hypothetical protein